MKINLYPHQEEALKKLRNGSILCGGVGSGKSRTALAYFFQQCGGRIYGNTLNVTDPKDLYIITTARKRDSLEWDKECTEFRLSTVREYSLGDILVTVDSWNNIKKYVDVKDAFFIFDEQRVVGSGAWVKSFQKIAKNNEWILLSATPGDTWMDYIPVFVANGFYKNRTEFIREHVVYNRYSRFPKVDKFVGVSKLIIYRKKILVNMPYIKPAIKHHIPMIIDFDKELMDIVWKDRWNPFSSEPIKDAGELCRIARRISNADLSRLDTIKDILLEKDKVIIFYNFDYELYILRTLKELDDFTVAEWNGHKHEDIPKTCKWIYLVQYNAGAEGWNCIETDTIIFYSQNYSYKIMSQAAGRIDRLNTPFKDLYYYSLRSNSQIDKMIFKALNNKKTFNEQSINFERSC